MSYTATPTNLGYTPTGTILPSGDTTVLVGSQVVMGRNLYATPTAAGLQFDAVGLGQGGRPDPVNRVVINLSNYFDQNKGFANGTYAFLTMDVNNVLDVLQTNPNAPGLMNFTLQEAATCETDANGNTTEMRRMVLMSQPYLPAS